MAFIIAVDHATRTLLISLCLPCPLRRDTSYKRHGGHIEIQLLEAATLPFGERHTMNPDGFHVADAQCSKESATATSSNLMAVHDAVQGTDHLFYPQVAV
jgi:hypothetical protein